MPDKVKILCWIVTVIAFAALLIWAIPGAIQREFPRIMALVWGIPGCAAVWGIVYGIMYIILWPIDACKYRFKQRKRKAQLNTDITVLNELKRKQNALYEQYTPAEKRLKELNEQYEKVNEEYVAWQQCYTSLQSLLGEKA